MPHKSIFDLIDYQRKYARKNRHKQKQRSREHYLANKAAYLLRAEAQRKRNPEKWREYDRLRYQRKKEETKKRMRAYYQKNKEAVKRRVQNYKQKNLKTIRAKQKETFHKYKEKYLSRNRAYYHKNKKRLRIKRKEWEKRNPGYQSRYRKEYYRRFPEAKVAHVLRTRLFKYLDRKIIDNTSVFRLVGCSLPTLRRHLENQFQPGMNWRNRGKVWHVDHIVAISLWDDKIAANHYTNLRPLFSKPNIRKGAKPPAHFVIRGKRIVSYSG